MFSYRNKKKINPFWLKKVHYSKCPKILYTKVSDKMAYAHSADLDQTAPEEQSDLGLHCLPFHLIHKKHNLGQKYMK